MAGMLVGGKLNNVAFVGWKRGVAGSVGGDKRAGGVRMGGVGIDSCRGKRLRGMHRTAKVGLAVTASLVKRVSGLR